MLATHTHTHSYTTHRVVCLDKRRTQQAENGFPSKLSACHGQSQRHSQAAQQASNDYNDSDNNSDNNNNRECTKQFQFQFCLHVCVCMCVWLAPFSKQLERPQRALSLCVSLSLNLPFALPCSLSLSLSLFDKYAQDIVYWRSASGGHKEAGGGGVGRASVCCLDCLVECLGMALACPTGYGCIACKLCCNLYAFLALLLVVVAALVGWFLVPQLRTRFCACQPHIHRRLLHHQVLV